MRELGTYIHQGVRNQLNGARDMFNVEVGILVSFLEKQSELERGMGNVVNALGDRLYEYNEWNNNKEAILKKISDAPIALPEMGENGNSTQQIQNKQTRLGKWKKEGIM